MGPPAGTVHLLDRRNRNRGTGAPVSGSQHDLGKPMAAMLVNADATAVVARSRSQDLSQDLAI